jgi:glycosyltransferase involved in cell wall biosynthesis
MDQTKICHLTSVHSRYDTRIFKKLCISLVNNKYDVYLIVADGNGNEIRNSVKIIDVGVEGGRLSRILVTRKKILEKSKELNCEIYHFHDPELLPIGLELRKIGFKVIFDSHEYLPGQILDKEYIPTFFRKLISYLVEKYFYINIKKLNAVISVTPHIIDKFKEMSGNAILITNYPILESDNTAFSKEEYIKRKNIVFYAGTIYETSQQWHIIKAIESIDNIKYSLVGTINDEYKNILNILPAWDKVELISFVPKIELDKIAMNTTIGLAIFDYIPNLGYKIGSLGVNKIFEYMLYGLPIICTDFILWKAIVQRYKCGIYVDSNDINSISRAIKHLIDNKEEAYEMGQNGRKAVFEEFNWNTQEKVLLQTYKSLLS